MCHGQDLGQDLGKLSKLGKVIHASTGIHATNTYKEIQQWWDDHTPLIPRLVCRQLRTGWQKDCWSQIWGGETRGDPLCLRFPNCCGLFVESVEQQWAQTLHMFAEFSDQDAAGWLIQMTSLWSRGFLPAGEVHPEDCGFVRLGEYALIEFVFFFCMETRDFQKEVKDIPWISSLRALSALLSVAVPLHYVHFSFVECRAASRLGSEAQVKQHPLCFSVQTDRGEAVSLDSLCS